MELNLMELLERAVLAAGPIVMVVEELLKLRVVPLKLVNRHPVPTNLVLSAIVTLLMAPLTGIDYQWSHWQEIGSLWLLTALSAAIAYNQLLDKWDQLKRLEGTPNDGK